MKYFPVFLDLRQKCCLVVGGGRVAERKVRSLLKAGAEVRMVSPQITAGLSKLTEKGKILCHARPFQEKDLKGVHLAIAATNDRKANEKIFHLCRRRRIWVNVVDEPSQSSFIVPSIVKRGDLVLAISTSGKSPALAKALRKKLEKEISPQYAAWLKRWGAVRQKVLALGLSAQENKRIFQYLTQETGGLPIPRKEWEGLASRLKDILGKDFRGSKPELRR